MSSSAQTLESWIQIPLEERMDVCPRFFCVCIGCVGSGLATGLIIRPGVLPTVYKIHNFRINSDGKQARGPNTKSSTITDVPTLSFFLK
jgi:hypothetical protein